jgi:cytochrome c
LRRATAPAWSPRLLLAGVALPALAGVKPGDAVKGKAVFTKNCVICHNADGSGGRS